MALNRRRSRDRQVQRVMLDEATTYDRMIHDEIDDWDETNNSTKRMADLTKRRHTALEASTHDTVPARAGNKVLESGKRIAHMEKAVEVLRRGGFMEDCAEVRTLRKHFTNSQDESQSSMPKLRATLMKKLIWTASETSQVPSRRWTAKLIPRRCRYRRFWTVSHYSA